MSKEVEQMKSLVQRVVRAAHEEKLWQRGNKIIVACSGGPDSLTLADILLQLQALEGIQVILAHFEHGIRGEDSVADAEFVREYAMRHQTKFFCAAENVLQLAKTTGNSVEVMARTCRYKFLYRLVREQGADLIATAHHADDQAETVLMRVLRGTGITGLAAMRPRQGNLIRPFLGIRRAEIMAYCEEHKLQPRQDATNFMPLYLRNRLRLELLPQLQQKYNPQIVSALTQLADMAAEAEEHFAAEGAQWLAGQPLVGNQEIHLDRGDFAALSAALQSNVIRCALQKIGLRDQISFAELRKIRTLICQGETGAELTLPAGWQLVLNYGQVWLRRKKKKDKPGLRDKVWTLTVPGVTEIPELGVKVTAELGTEKPENLSAWRIVVDAGLLPSPYRLRTRQHGDSFAIQGGRKKLKDFFIDCKLPREQREKVPVFIAGEEIFWLGGLRQPYFAWVTEQTKQYLCFTLEENFAKQEEGKC